jgi:lipid-binding SYLF domain-containing protein
MFCARVKCKGENKMLLSRIMKVGTILCVLLAMSIGVVSAQSVEEKRQEIRNIASDTLSEVYKLQPHAKNAVADAAGYAAFTITDARQLFIDSGVGKGMAVDNATGQNVFMKTGDVQVGFGLQIKKYAVLFVFGTKKALSDFITSGWKFDGQATVAANDSLAEDSLQGAFPVSADVWMYQVTDKGLEFSPTVRGIRYFKDNKLN